MSCFIRSVGFKFDINPMMIVFVFRFSLEEVCTCTPISSIALTMPSSLKVKGGINNKT